MLKKSEILKKIKSDAKSYPVNKSSADIILFCNNHKYNIKRYKEHGHSFDCTKYWKTLNFIVKDKDNLSSVKATKRDTWIQHEYKSQYTHEQQYIIEWIYKPASNTKADYKIMRTSLSRTPTQNITAIIIFNVIAKMSMHSRN